MKGNLNPSSPANGRDHIPEDMKRNKWLTGLGIVAGIVVLVKVLTVMLLEIRLPQILEQSCRKNGWILENGTVHAYFLSTGFEIRDLSIHHEPGKKRFNLSISCLCFDGIHPFSLWLKDNLIIRKVTLESGRLETSLSVQTASKPFLMPIPVKIGSMDLQNFGGQISDSTGKMMGIDRASAHFENLDFKRDENIARQVMDKMTAHADYVKVVTSDSLYTLAIDGLDYSASGQKLSATKFRVIPSYEDYAFTRRNRYQVDCIDAAFHGITLEKFPVGHCLASGSILAGLVRIDSMKLDVFRDRRKKDPRTPMQMPQQALYKLPLQITVDTVELGGGSITYSEHIRETDRLSTVQFTEVTARCTGITNDTNTSHHWLHLVTEARVLGRAPIHCDVIGKLFDPNYSLQFRGNMGGINGKAFNGILENSAPVKIKSGVLDRLDFAFRLNAFQSAGTMKMLYHDLEFAANPDFTTNTIVWAFAFISFLGLKKTLEANPLDDDDPIRIGEIGIPRDIEKSIFNYSLQTLLSGSQSTLNKKNRKASKDN